MHVREKVGSRSTRVEVLGIPLEEEHDPGLQNGTWHAMGRTDDRC